MRVQEAVQSLRAFGKLGEVALLERLRERIEQTPDVSCLERFMVRFTPFVEHCGNAAVAAHPDVHRANDEVMDGFIADLQSAGRRFESDTRLQLILSGLFR